MKEKVLLTGRNRSIIDDFFFHINFECQSTSMRYDDIVSHVKYFKPNAIVYCIQDEDKDDINRLASLKETFRENGVAFVLIGDKEDCDDFERLAYNVADLILVRPITITAIQDRISHHLFETQRAKTAEEANDALSEAMNAVQQVESMMELEDMRKHILVVDDDSRMLKVVKVHLKAKYNVATAINGKLAMKFLEKKKTDLILLDYQMPGENGPEIFEKLKSNPDTKDIPVVFLTGVDDMKKVQEVLKLKPQGYLLKPIEHDKLISTIEGLIG